jgi:hypothetical protein
VAELNDSYRNSYVLMDDIRVTADAMMLAEQRTVSFADIFCSEMDAMTYRLESQGYRIWFTCEVDGVEYRLAARKQREPSPSAAKCGLGNPRCSRPINCTECYPWQRM